MMIYLSLKVLYIVTSNKNITEKIKAEIFYKICFNQNSKALTYLLHRVGTLPAGLQINLLGCVPLSVLNTACIRQVKAE